MGLKDNNINISYNLPQYVKETLQKLILARFLFCRAWYIIIIQGLNMGAILCFQ